MWRGGMYEYRRISGYLNSLSLSCQVFMRSPNADPSPWDPCIVAAMDKFTGTTEILWRKGTAQLLSKWERRPWPLPGQAFIAFLGSLHQGWSSFTLHRLALGSDRKQRSWCPLITSQKKDICKCKGKSGWTGYTPYLGGLAQVSGSYFKDMQ